MYFRLLEPQQMYMKMTIENVLILKQKYNETKQ